MMLSQEALVVAHSLPTDFPRPIPSRSVEATLSSALTEASSKALLGLSSTSAAPFSLLLTAFAILLHRQSGEEELAFCSSALDFSPVLLRILVSKNDSFSSLLAKVQQAEEEPLSLYSVSENLSARDTLCRIRFFNLTDTNAQTLAATTTTGSHSDLTLFISQEVTLRRILPITIRLVYNSVLFTHQRMVDLLAQLESVIQQAAKDPQAPIGCLSLVTLTAQTLLPNPSEDLGWDDFEGPITAKFASQARENPNKICVVESVSQESHVRTFTYTQLNRASNLLAHHLLRQGIQREDVVVLYSYRGVDLVVAIMGVLKAGATFSVIDPAYPPSRQITYLSVAQPRGLVILRKAGILHPDVRTYISESLSIQCEVPSLFLKDDGSLEGSFPDSDDDLFASEQDIEPDVLLGPDSIGTLSFTSGSTGIPKGVRGRHFSLTHFYPWMAKEFQLTANERFTMLSGIAHDPIQRDIFTPLFLGAQIHIPTADDIGYPGRLAEWMARHEITITHLTPAMGQLLSANATHPIPSLRHAFFVGDILTKRDVLRLQHLANNTHVINMYGTTETQRAVSFLKIPPVSSHPSYLSEQKDIMPAGKGMKNVQLLVINRFNKQCGIGELGELYVRSSGLSEGYLRLDDVTASKFIRNPLFTLNTTKSAPSSLPYYLGPRDRMYRTGDLGRYRPDGSVECAGRADDQVKIRGFRIELGEIDTHLSQHPAIRENVTLVRRDKYEEQTLVSYFVPLEDQANVSALVKDIRDYLKLKLPVYAIPSVFVPLTRMPLTPNGKVDKNSLPFPDTALAMTAHESNESSEKGLLSPIQESVRSIWAALLVIPASSIRLSDSFFDMGGHSILATRLVFEIRKQLALDVPLGIVYREPTLKGMATELEHIKGDDLNLAGQAILGLSEENVSKGPLVLEKPTIDVQFDYSSELDLVDDLSIADCGLRLEFPSRSDVKFFLTGVTGFLGAFIMSALLERFPSCNIYCLVRAKDQTSAVSRVRENLERHLLWKSSYLERFNALCGDLGLPKFGLNADSWESLAESVDVIIHNGALVHWVYPYEKLKAPNVLGTIEALRLATSQKLKPFHFVSSTSVLDTDHYVNLLSVGKPVLESDNLKGSRTGLQTGYGQSKWVAENIIFRAQARGVPATIIRPGYIVGDSKTGVSNSDDFLWRLVKGCIQLGKIPRIANVINMCPVDYVAGAIAEISAHEESLAKGVFHIWNSQRFSFDDMFAHLTKLEYQVEQTEYIHWRSSLMDFTLSSSDNALYPLLHFVLDDLPTSTKSPELDDSNTRAIVDQSEGRVKCERVDDLMPLYLGYFTQVGFLDAPPMAQLPRIDAWQTLKGKMVARNQG